MNELLTMLTGFLGAGKTTLLNRVLNADHGLPVAVLVSDVGSINIDAELVAGIQVRRMGSPRSGNPSDRCERRNDGLLRTINPSYSTQLESASTWTGG